MKTTTQISRKNALRASVLGGLLLAGGVFQSCNKHISAGPMTTEDRVMSDSITAIQVQGSMDVFITQDTSYDVRIEAGEKLMSYISTSLQNNELVIDERANQFIKNDRVRIYVSANNLDKIYLKGSGDVNGSNLIGNHVFVRLDGSGDVNLSYSMLNSMDVDLEGSGDINISGVANDSHVELKGSGDINCKDLTVNEAHVDLDGSGDIKVYVLNELTANVSGSGDVYYWGNPPVVNSNVSGSGQVTGM